MSRIHAEEAFVVDVQCSLHAALKKSKLRQKDLAAMLGVSEARVSQMFSDEAPNLTLRTVAAAFHVLGKDIALKVKRSAALTARNQGR
jgi:transcriptional regulator with XRE-family HTH domain